MERWIYSGPNCSFCMSTWKFTLCTDVSDFSLTYSFCHRPGMLSFSARRARSVSCIGEETLRTGHKCGFYLQDMITLWLLNEPNQPNQPTPSELVATKPGQSSPSAKHLSKDQLRRLKHGDHVNAQGPHPQQSFSPCEAKKSQRTIEAVKDLGELGQWSAAANCMLQPSNLSKSFLNLDSQITKSIQNNGSLKLLMQLQKCLKRSHFEVATSFSLFDLETILTR